jgi:hypothetical protein
MGKIGKCKSFSLDLMHLGMNETGEIKNLVALKEHLNGCKKCLAHLAKLKEVAVFTFLGSPRSAKYKDGMKKLLERAKSESGGKEKQSNCNKDED